jgi:hypothetical protein
MRCVDEDMTRMAFCLKADSFACMYVCMFVKSLRHGACIRTCMCIFTQMYMRCVDEDMKSIVCHKADSFACTWHLCVVCIRTCMCIAGHTAFLIIIEGHKTACNGFQYQFTTRKLLKNLKPTLNYY